ncbi:SLC13 family permease [Celerinatantimonas diazotrophica]|uniref:Anion transporter n=1 Tax=Celerinatantimonas diazotrophica TaxID=412034 RepID=A0A4R1K7V7_9GAMM|nr:SLC13 family permease [Celerinatantimonas diazotrophica]TCK60362.1 anion transporter [Celerinatantimonas diazotrophica]CAG9295079.1 hypothetical protein CEDIAZO_00191 [Celerinatantimonas diazotrophica]
MISLKKLVVAGITLIAILLVTMPTASMTHNQAQTLALVLITLSLWATGIVPGYLASLGFFACALILKIAPPATVFSGFTSAAIWLIFTGFIIAAAIRGVGLSERIGIFLERHLISSYGRLLGGLMLFCMLLAFIMPSSLGRTVLMIPIGMALADRVGFNPKAKGRTAIALVIAFGCHIPSFAILPANIPNIVLSGAAQTILGINVTYAHYLLLHYPILGILKSSIIVVMIMFFFPDHPKSTPSTNQDISPDPLMKRKQTTVIIVLLLTLGFWMTDSIHGINPAWIGIVAAIILLMPGIGVVTPNEFNHSVNFGLILFISGILAVGAVVNATGLGSWFAHQLVHILPLQPKHDFINFLSLCFVSFATGLITTLPGVPAVITPMTKELASLTGFSLNAVLMTQVIGFSTVLFPYQSGPLTVAMQLSEQPMNKLLKITIPLTIITALVLVPMDYLWWKFLGMF